MKSLYRISAAIILCSLSCLPPDNQGYDGESITINLDEQVGAATPEGTGCHFGTFECADGPEVSTCGNWMFDVNETGAVSGTGTIIIELTGEQIPVLLSGVVDPGVETYTLDMSTADGGAGNIEISYDGGSLNLTGVWSFRDGPEPEGNEIEGGVTGSSCTPLQ